MNTECCFSCFEIMKNISRVQIPWFLIEVVLTLQLVQVRLWFPWLSSQKLCEPNCHSELHLFITHTTNLVTTVYLKYKQVGTFFFEKTKKKQKPLLNHSHCLEILVRETDCLWKSEQVQLLPLALFITLQSCGKKSTTRVRRNLPKNQEC